MTRGLVAALALVLLLPGCGHERTGSGSASLWITRDRGATVVLVRTVPAGLTAMQALDEKAGHLEALRRPLRPVDRRRRRRRLQAPRLVLVPERHRGRPERGRLPASARRRRVVGLPIVERRDARARRRRRLPRAVPTRLGREGAGGRSALRTRPGSRRTCDRAIAPRGLRRAPRTADSGRGECLLGRERNGSLLGVADGVRRRSRLAGPLRLRRRRGPSRSRPDDLPLPVQVP